MAEAVVRLGLDPAGMVAGAARATESVRSIGQATTRAAQVATRSGEKIGQAGTRAGQKFGRDLVGGVRQSVPQFNRIIDQAARQAQQRLSSIRPTPIRMPAVQQAGAPRAVPGAFTDAGGRLRDSRGRYAAGGPRTGAGAARPGVVPGAGGVGGDAGLSRLWSLSALGSQLRGVADRAIQLSDQNVDIASGRQVARAEMRTVVDDAGGRETVRAAARESALGRGGMVVAIDESSFTAAVFRGVASGLKTERAVSLVPVASDLALAGQTTPEQAQIGLTDTGNVFSDRSFRDLGDIYARGQDIGTFLNIDELFQAVTKMGSTAKAAGISFEETVAIATTLSSLGPTFRGSTGGQKGLMAVREMELGAMGKLGMATMRDASGGLDFSANIRQLAAVDASVADINQAFGKRAAPAILALMADVKKLDSTILDLQDAQGTAASNAREHAGIWRSTLQQNQAAIDVFAADVGEGAMILREAGIVAKGTLARLFAGVPGAGQAAGVALEVGGRAGQLGVGALDALVGVHAFKQLAHGTLNPVNLFRSEGTVGARQTARMEARQTRAQQRGIRAGGRQWRGLFGQMTRGTATSRGGFRTMFGAIRVGAVRLGGIVAAELAGALAGRAVAGVAGGTAAGAAGAAAGKGAASFVGSAVRFLGPVALTAAVVNLIATGKKDDTPEARDRRLSLERSDMEARLGRPVTDVEFALRGLPGEALHRLGFSGLAEKLGLGAWKEGDDLLAAPDPAVTKAVAPAPAETVAPAAETVAQPPAVTVPDEGLLKRVFLPAYPTPPAAETSGGGALARFQTARDEGKGVLGSVWRGLGFGQSGEAIPQTLGEGMVAGAEGMGVATDQMLGPVDKRMAKSDAELGPLSTLTASGRAIPATLAAGVTEGAPVLQSAVSEMLAGIGLPLLAAPDTLPTPETLAPAAPDVPALAVPAMLPPADVDVPPLAPPDALDAPALVPPAAVDVPPLLTPDAPTLPPLAPPALLAPAVP